MKTFKEFLEESSIHGFKEGETHTLKSGHKITIEKVGKDKVGFSWKDRGTKQYHELDAKHDQPTLLHKIAKHVVFGHHFRNKPFTSTSSSSSKSDRSNPDEAHEIRYNAMWHGSPN